MACPFDLTIPEEEEDPMHDPDEDHIVEKPKEMKMSAQLKEFNFSV